MSKTDKITKSSVEPINKNKALVEAKIKKLLKRGRKAITTKAELQEYPKGSLVSYVNKQNIFKSGGFLMKIADDYFIYLNSDEDKKYKGRFENVQTIYVGNVYEVEDDIVSIIKTTKAKTKWPVKINDIIIYYAHNSYDKDRFMCTDKYKMIKKWYDFFGDTDENNIQENL
jgi:hypothetical protein